MKRTRLLLIALFTGAVAFAQDSKPIDKTVSDRDLVDMGIAVVNQFECAVKKLNECPCEFLDGTLQLFAKGAKIEVTSLRHKKPKLYDPEPYFRTINALKCGREPLYRNFRFTYEPVSDADARVERMGTTKTVTFRVTQRFSGIPLNGKDSYCDITIKEITISFVRDLAGVEQPFILGVIATSTGNCQVNYNSHDASLQTMQ